MNLSDTAKIQCVCSLLSSGFNKDAFMVLDSLDQSKFSENTLIRICKYIVVLSPWNIDKIENPPKSFLEDAETMKEADHAYSATFKPLINNYDVVSNHIDMNHRMTMSEVNDELFGESVLDTICKNFK